MRKITILRKLKGMKKEVLFSFNCSNIKINLFRLIIQLILNSSFKDIQRQICVLLCYTHWRFDAENLFQSYLVSREKRREINLISLP